MTHTAIGNADPCSTGAARRTQSDGAVPLTTKIALTSAALRGRSSVGAQGARPPPGPVT